MVLLLAAFVCSPLMAETSPTPITTGLDGMISMSPGRPGPLRQGDPETMPVPKTRFVVQKEGKQVASFTTDAEGGFRVSLEPGRYTVVRDDASARVGHWHFEAEVTAGKVTRVQWTGDSGMR
jgi:hypothetical protein